LAGYAIFATNIYDSVEVATDSRMGARRVCVARSFDIPWQGSEGSVIADCETFLLIPNWRLKIYHDDNECWIHARNLITHGYEDFVNILPGRISSKFHECNDLGELKSRK
jgi:hypothetical protein